MSRRFVFMDEHELLNFFGKSKRKCISGKENEVNDFDESVGALVDTVEKRILIDLGNYTAYYNVAGSMPSDEDKEMLENLLNGDKDDATTNS